MFEEFTETDARDPAPARPRARNGFAWGCLVWLLIAWALILFIARQLAPPDWVELSIGPMPGGLSLNAVVVEDREGLHALRYYESKVIPFTLEAHKFTPSSIGGGVFRTAVQWRDGGRYGLLFGQDEAGPWLFRWLQPEELTPPRPMALRWLIGGGAAAMRLEDGMGFEEPTEELIRELGFSPQDEQGTNARKR